MKKSISAFALSVVITATVMTSCNSSAEKVEDAKENVIEASHDLDQAEENYTEEYNKFQLETEQKISDNEKSIIVLKEHTKSIKKEVKADYEKTIAALEQRNAEMKEQAKNYKGEGQEKWQSFKREFNHDMDELGQALKDLTKNNSN